MYRKFGKRFLDIVLSFVAIVILSPIFIIISLLVLIFMGWPILFKQPRVGKDEKIFNMYKFRTMTNAKDSKGNLLPDEQRLTKFGFFLRKTSLDELPELWLVFFGAMSFIGPRPLLVQYLPYYTEEEHHRHDVRPGLTGLAQASGRNLIGWDERFKKDVEYVNHISFGNDLKIFFKTIGILVRGEGITDNQTATMTFLDVERKNMVCKRVIIIGAGGHARVIADIVKENGDEVIGFLDDDKRVQGKAIFEDKKVVGTTQKEDVIRWKDSFFIIGIGDNNARKKIAEKYSDLKWYTAIHPSAVISENVKVGNGSAVMAGTVINIGSEIGEHCIINTASSIDHDNQIKNFVHISPGAHLAGNVTIGELTWIGAGATVINKIEIAKNNIIGAGAVVVSNLPKENTTFIGVPAREK